MVEPLVHGPVAIEHKSHRRTLHGFRLWLARGAYLVLFTLILTFFFIGLPAYLELDLSFVFAVYRYRLWDPDLYINRTLVYSLVTLLLMIVWVATTQVLNYASEQLLGKQAGWLGALLSSLQVAVIYKPVRKWVEKWINSRFYKDRIDYSEALVELKPEMWTYLTPVDLGHTLVTTVPSLLQSMSGGNISIKGGNGVCAGGGAARTHPTLPYLLRRYERSLIYPGKKKTGFDGSA
jgi:hypothetical protein